MFLNLSGFADKRSWIGGSGGLFRFLIIAKAGGGLEALLDMR